MLIYLQSNANTKKPKDHLYKILVIGDLGTGKTSIIKRYVHRFFTQHYRATIGVDFALKVLNWDEDTLIRLQLWDIAGNLFPAHSEIFVFNKHFCRRKTVAMSQNPS